MVEETTLTERDTVDGIVHHPSIVFSADTLGREGKSTLTRVIPIANCSTGPTVLTFCVDVPVELENSIRPSKTRCAPGRNITMSKLISR